MHLAFFIFVLFITFLSHLVFVFTSDCLSLPLFLILSVAVDAMTVKCDDSVYYIGHIDVDVEL